MKEEGFKVTVSQLCRWFEVARRTVYYRPTKTAPKLREELVAVSAAAPAQIRLELSKDRTIVWGDDTQSETKAQVATALLEHKGDTIDVSAPDVVTIR